MDQPQIPLSEATLPLFCGVDIGGTNIKIGLVDDLGRTLAFESIPTMEPQGPQQAVDRAAETCRQLCEQLGVEFDQVARIGLGAPGSMCLKSGKFLEPPNLPNWYGFEVRRAFEKATSLPVSFINDANAAAFGEFWIGTGAEYDSLAMFTLGTGVGGGLICDGMLINGENSFGSECGHVIVDSSPEARLCVWGGGKGHLEAYASASAVVAYCSERLAEGAESSLTSIPAAELTAKKIYEAAREGDEFSLEMIDTCAYYLGIGVATVVHIVDPTLVVIGGAMDFGGKDCPVGQRFVAKVTEEFHNKAFSTVASSTEIRFASLGGDAGYIGAAGIARHDYHSQSTNKAVS